MIAPVTIRRETDERDDKERERDDEQRAADMDASCPKNIRRGVCLYASPPERLNRPERFE